MDQKAVYVMPHTLLKEFRVVCHATWKTGDTDCPGDSDCLLFLWSPGQFSQFSKFASVGLGIILIAFYMEGNATASFVWAKIAFFENAKRMVRLGFEHPALITKFSRKKALWQYDYCDHIRK